MTQRKEIDIILQDHALNDRQMALVRNYLAGDPISTAGAKAGYGGTAAYVAMKSPKLQAALSRIMDQFLTGPLTVEAMRQALRLLTDDRTPAGVRANLALGVMDRSGFSAKRREASVAATKDVSEMSMAELDAEINRISTELEGRLKDVSEPVSEPITSEELDMYS